MEQSIRIFISEDHALLRDALRAMFASLPDYEIIGEAADGLETIHSVEACKPDLVLLDLSMPKMDGLEALNEIKKKLPDTKVLILTIHNANQFVLPAFKAGADGYLLKTDTKADLLTAIKKILNGDKFLSPGVSRQVIEGYVCEGKTADKAQEDMLTHQERKILKLIAEGHTNRKIAGYLCISEKTVIKHRSNMMKKLHLHNVSQLTAFALSRGMVEKYD